MSLDSLEASLNSQESSEEEDNSRVGEKRHTTARNTSGKTKRPRT
jgi:hypothetical protein